MKTSFLALLATALLIPCSIAAQTPIPFERGTIFSGSYHGGDIDKVDLMSGAVSFTIPLFSLPQKGKLALSYSLVFSSNNLRAGEYCTTDYSNDQYEPTTYCGQASVFGASIDPQLVMDQAIGLSYTQPTVDNDWGCQAWWPCSAYGNYAQSYSINESDGASHPTLVNSGTHNTLYASDGSGYLVHVNNLTPDETQCTYPQFNYESDASIVTADGITHDMSVTSSTCTTYSSAVWPRIRDRAGNQMTVQEDGMTGQNYGGVYIPPVGTVIDSVGRTIPAPSNLLGSTTGCPNLGVSSQTATDSKSWTVPGPNGSDVTYLFCYTFITYNSNEITNYGDAEAWGINGSAMVLQSVLLPNNTYWGFVYQSDGMTGPPNGDYTTLPEAHPEITKLIYPTGGSVSYTYQSGSACYDSADDQRSVTSRWPSGTSVPWTYTYGSTSTGTQTTVTDPTGNDTVHQFTDAVFCYLKEESPIQQYQGTGTSRQLLETETKQYEVLPSNPLGVLPTSITKQLAGGTTLTTSLAYPTLTTGVVIVCNEADIASSLTFFNGNCSEQQTLPILFANPGSTVTTDPLGTTSTSFTDFEWQHPGNPSNALAANDLMLPTSNCLISGNVSSCGTPTSAASYTSFSYDSNGNQLSQSSYDNQTNNWVTTSLTYIPSGKVYKITDPNNRITTYCYTSGTPCYGGNDLFPTSVTRPSTANAQHVSFYNYDDNTGNLLAQVDENGSSISDAAHRTDYTYDTVGRLINVKAPPIYGQRAETEICYTDLGGGICNASSTPPYSIYRLVRADPDPDQMSYVALDMFGRNTRSVGADSAIVDTTYDDLGRVASVSNPYFSTSDATYGITTWAYDALGRKLRQCQPDNGTGTTCLAGTSYLKWSYGGDTTDSYDESGHHWQRTSNGRGVLFDVLEPDPATNTPSLDTHYYYDVLGNLSSVVQVGNGSETPRTTRTFNYSTISRLESSFNPETGTITYVYDPNGNVTLKTDARGATVNYHYDELGRLTSKTAVGASSGTTSSCYWYDSPPAGAGNFTGRLAQEWTQTGSCPTSPPATSAMQTQRFIQLYDAMGRILSEQRCVLASCSTSSPVTLTHAFDLANNLIEYSTGVGTLSLTNYYDSGGRLYSTTSSVFDGTDAHPESLYNVTSFAATGAPQTFNLGMSTSVTRAYDTRLRPAALTATKK